MKNKILRINNLVKNYNTMRGEINAIKEISFDVNEGEFLVIVGSSGCGKSTLLSILSDLETLTDGNILKNDSLKIGYMLQEDALLPWLTIYENAILGLKIKKIDTQENIDEVIRLLKLYNLYDFKDKYPKNLSGGMKQRVALIRTLAIKPDLLLLDEPFSALDYQSRLAVSDDVYKIIKKEKKTVIMVTHDLAEAISMADRIIVLSKRPATIKKIYDIKLEHKSTPINNRKDGKFSKYYEMIWRDLDVNI